MSADLPSDEEARALLGQRVRVTMVRGGEGGDPQTITSGVLVGFGQGGDFEILEGDGMIHYCWPMLQIERINDDQ
jgi:hypothetical protein